MKLWKRAVGVLKDKNSVYLAGLSRRTPYRNPHLEVIVIKATSHDESSVDYKNFQRVYQWARASPLYMKPFIGSLSTRMTRTRSWVVAVKGLMLIHGVFCCKNVPAAHRIGRLPFDLSAFVDAHSSRAWGFNAFVRAYFAYLDRRSAFLAEASLFSPPVTSGAEIPLTEELLRLVTWQSLFDLLLQVKPQSEKMIKVGLIFEAMICVLTEVFEVYSRIWRGIGRALVRVYASPAGKKAQDEARITLRILHKARDQGDVLALFFELCREMGVLNPSCSPKVERIPEEDLRELERIINGVSKQNDDRMVVVVVRSGHDDDDDQVINQGKTIVSNESNKVTTLETIVTDKWEVFEEEEEEEEYYNNDNYINHDYALIDVQAHHEHNRVLPDLISF